MRSFLLALPTYNERGNIRSLIERVFAASDDLDILVIDDSSPDGTAGVVRDLMIGDSRIHLIVRPEKLGLGSAYIIAFAYASTNGYRGVITMDADHSHDPAVIARMISALENADLVIGSRYVTGGTTDQSLTRRINSAVANALARNVLDLSARDCTSGFRLYGTSILSKLDLPALRSRGYSMLVELLCKVADANGRVTEVPIVFRDRSAGESKIGVHEIWESVRTIARLRRGRFGNIRTKLANQVYRLIKGQSNR